MALLGSCDAKENAVFPTQKLPRKVDAAVRDEMIALLGVLPVQGAFSHSYLLAGQK